MNNYKTLVILFGTLLVLCGIAYEAIRSNTLIMDNQSFYKEQIKALTDSLSTMNSTIKELKVDADESKKKQTDLINKLNRKDKEYENVTLIIQKSMDFDTTLNDTQLLQSSTRSFIENGIPVKVR